MKTKVGIDHDKSRRLPWRVFWFGEPGPDGKQPKYVKSFRHAREAQAFQVDKQADLNHGGRRDRPETVTLGQLVEEFRSARLANLSYSTNLSYGTTIDQLFEYFGADRDIRLIAQRHAEMFVSTRKRVDGKPEAIRSWTRKRHASNAGAIFRAALEWDFIEANPFKPRDPRSNSPLRIRTQSRPWHHIKPDEFLRIMAHVPTAQKRSSFWLMYGCGLRPGEVYNLQIEKIDLEGGQILIESRPATADLPPFVVKCDSMTDADKSRTVPIPECVMPDLTEAVTGAFRSGGFVAMTPERFQIVQANWRLCRAGKPWGGRAEHKPWRNQDMLLNLLRSAKGYVRAAGIEMTAPFDLKTFRKSFAQNAADNAIPPRTLAEFLGDDVRVVMRYYQQVTPQAKRAVVDAIDRQFKKHAKLKNPPGAS